MILLKMASLLKNIIKLIRPHQWYKNLVIFLAIIFSKNFFNLGYLAITINGFVILVIISSANYIFNDLIDSKKDKLNPEKRDRPLVAGNVNNYVAISLFFIFLIVGLTSAYLSDIYFFYIVLGIFITSTAYTLYLKNILFADLLSISLIFALRAVSGAVIIDVFISPWLVIGVFFFSLFLVTGKRYGEMEFLNKNSWRHRAVLKYYSKDLLFSLFNIFMTILILVFALYSFSSEYKSLIWITPLFIYLILRYYYLILSNSEIVRSPEKVIKDPLLLVPAIIFIVVSFIMVIFT